LRALALAATPERVCERGSLPFRKEKTSDRRAAPMAYKTQRSV